MLDDPCFLTSNGAVMLQYQSTPAEANQQWKFVTLPNGNYRDRQRV